MPTKTPVRLPASRPAAMPASSSASQATSSSSRCCGSMLAASRGEMPKKAASKLVDVVEEAASCVVHLARPARGRGRSRRRRPSDRAESADRVDAVCRAGADSEASSCTPPGKRQPMPTIAIGSVRGRLHGRPAAHLQFTDLEQRPLERRQLAAFGAGRHAHRGSAARRSSASSSASASCSVREPTASAWDVEFAGVALSA